MHFKAAGQAHVAAVSKIGHTGANTVEQENVSQRLSTDCADVSVL